MIAYIFGRADNYDLIFERNHTGQWQCIVPFEKDGQYVVTLYAVDEAGNVSYYSKVLFTIDTNMLYTQIYPIKYYLEKTDKRQKMLILNKSCFDIKNIESEYKLIKEGDLFELQLLRHSIV